MLFLSVLAAGGFMVSAKVYQERRYRKKKSWTIYQRKLVQQQRQYPRTQVEKMIIFPYRKVICQTKETIQGLGIEFRYAHYYWREYWKEGIFTLVLFSAYQGLFIILAYGLQVVVDGTPLFLGLPALPFIAAISLIGVPLTLWLNWQGGQLVAKLQSHIANDLRGDLFVSLQNLSSTYFQDNQSGDLASRFVTDTDLLIENISATMVLLALDLVVMAIILPQLFLIEWHLALIILVTIPLTFFLFSYIGPKAINATYRFKQDQGILASQVQESVHIHSMIKSFEAEGILITRFQKQLNRLRNQQYESLYQVILLTVASIQFLLMTQVLVTLLGAVLVVIGTITAGMLVAFVGLLGLLVLSVQDIMSWILPDMIGAVGGAKRLDEILAQKPTVVDAPDAYALPRLQEAIRIEDVSFSYNQRQNNLQHLTVTIPAGQYVALVGPNGAGKSTLLKLLMRLYDVDQGCISFDGHDLRKITQTSLRAQMSIVFQQPLLFNATIAENIRVSKPDASDEDIAIIAKEAQIHDFITSLPDGYNTLVGEGGGHLSGGQQQKIAIARALLRDPAILILDEISTGLDSESREAIQETINAIVKGRTVIAVSHDTSELSQVDQVIHLADGQLVSSEEFPFAGEEAVTSARPAIIEEAEDIPRRIFAFGRWRLIIEPRYNF